MLVDENFWGIIISVLIGGIILFLIFREFFCWYWKINRITALLEEQNELQSDLINIAGILTKTIQKDTNRSNDLIAHNDTKKCPFCAELIKEEAIVCRFCGRNLPKEQEKVFVNEIVFANAEIDEIM